MPRDPKDISVTSGQRTQRRLGELDDQKDPIRLRIGSGPAGAEGKEGKAGTNGATWYTGAGAPASELGVNNDLYLRTSNDEVYKKVAGAWTELVNIKGEKGETGGTGATGPSGTGAPLPARLATAAALPAYTRTTNKLEANANGALGKIDEVTAAVNDLVLLKDGAAGADNGVYKITSVGGTLSKWTMERYESMDTSPEAVPGMLITVSEGARNKDEVYQLTTDAPITLNTTALTFKRTAPRDFGLVEALPTSEAVKGDKCQYVADKTNGVVWNLVYDGEGEFPWKKIGGPPLVAQSGNSRALTNQLTYASLPTDPLTVKAPLKGDYDIEIAAEFIIGSISEAAGRLSYAIGATAAADSWSIAQQIAAAGTSVLDPSKKTRQTGVTAGAEIIEKGKTFGNYTVSWQNRRLWVDPVRIG